MLVTLSLLCVLSTLALAAPAAPLRERTSFLMWARREGKVYSSPEEEHHRQSIWLENKAFVDSSNAVPGKSYQLAMNEYGDLSNSEFQSLLLTQQTNSFNLTLRHQTINSEIAQAKQRREEPFFYWYTGRKETTKPLPTSFDWRTKNVVGPVKNQGICGSCYAFSSSAALETATAIATGNAVKSISEQAIIDCTSNSQYGNSGCNGGAMDTAFAYIYDAAGIDSDGGYPYTQSQGSCKRNKANTVATVSQVAIFTQDETMLQAAVAETGPISAGINASPSSFQFYSTGVYDEPACPSTGLNHAVVIVGYGTLNGKDYWIAKNSWGSNWGAQGYILMSRNKNNQCGIASMASLPIVKASNACASSPCKLGSTCSSAPAGFVCACAAGYTGQQCQSALPVSACASSPCGPGRCILELAGFSCQCDKTGQVGALCEVAVDSGLLSSGMVGTISQSTTDLNGLRVVQFQGGYLSLSQNLVDGGAALVPSFVVGGYLQGDLPLTSSRSMFVRSQEAVPSNAALQYFAITFLADLSLSLSYQYSGRSMKTFKLNSATYPALRSLFGDVDASNMAHFAVAFSQSLLPNSLTVVVYVDGLPIFTMANNPNQGVAGRGNPYRIGSRYGTSQNWLGAMKAVNFNADLLGVRSYSQTNMLCDAAGDRYFCATRRSCPMCTCSSSLTTGINCS